MDDLPRCRDCTERVSRRYTNSMAKRPDNVTPMVRYQAVNRDTGEVTDIDGPAFRRGKKRGRRRMFALIDLEAQARLELTGQEWAVLHVIMRAVNAETNEARIGREEIAADLGVAAPNVTRVMRTLRDRRIITTLRQGVHRVNAHLMFRGSAQDWDTITETEREPQWKR
jgi:hypothetical protein